ncbi:hypothetical protein IFM47457_06871 [Aspergillus lentulus]|nr:hypothetical protein IFM47457_06871 [Aspergillus lentulus]
MEDRCLDAGGVREEDREPITKDRLMVLSTELLIIVLEFNRIGSTFDRQYTMHRDLASCYGDSVSDVLET